MKIDISRAPPPSKFKYMISMGPPSTIELILFNNWFEKQTFEVYNRIHMKDELPLESSHWCEWWFENEEDLVQFKLSCL